MRLMGLVESRCDPRFRPLLDDFGQTVVGTANDPIYGLLPDLKLAFMNAAWFRFAAENRGEPAISREWNLGRCVLDAIPSPIRPFFETNFRRSLTEARRWEHSYECSSDEVERRFRLTVYPLGRAQGLLVVNSLENESPRQQTAFPPTREQYVSTGGVVTQCCHCHKFRRVGGQVAWDWVPAWIKHMPAPQDVSHGICPMCFAFYYSERKRAGDEPQNFSPIS
jgi:hypothetical protein